MNFIKRIFGIKVKEPAKSVSPRAIDELIQPLMLPSIQLVKTNRNTNSYLGGLPSMPASTVWPTNNGRPLVHLATLCLDEVEKAYKFDWLPGDGKLIFFYDIEKQPWGFDPKDVACWKVIFVSADEPVEAVQNPSEDLSEEYLIPKKYLEFELIKTYPSWEREVISDLNFTEEEFQLLDDMQNQVYQNKPQHQIGGFPNAMQNDQMELECQLVSNGLYCGDSSGYENPKAKKLKAGAGEWRLLFQMDSDDELDVMWGDAGLIYFWIKKSDSIGKKFENTWLILQCG